MTASELIVALQRVHPSVDVLVSRKGKPTLSIDGVSTVIVGEGGPAILLFVELNEGEERD